MELKKKKVLIHQSQSYRTWNSKKGCWLVIELITVMEIEHWEFRGKDELSGNFSNINNNDGCSSYLMSTHDMSDNNKVLPRMCFNSHSSPTKQILLVLFYRSEN